MDNSKIAYTIEQLSQKIGIASTCIEQDIALSKRTWIHRGGVAKWWFRPTNYKDLLRIGIFLYKEQCQFDIIGHTSNIYFTNSYNPDIILDTKLVKGIKFENNEIICDAGTPISQIAKKCVQLGICGYEGLIDLPGTVGAATVNNSGCFGCEISNLVKEIEILTPNGLRRLTNAELNYTHRNSILKSGGFKGIVLRVWLNAFKYPHKINTLLSIAAKNHEIRVRTQEKPNHNLGSTFTFTTLKQNYQHFIVRIITRFLNICKTSPSIILKVQKYTYLFLQNKLHLARYISNKNLNTYLFIDEHADRQFPHYVEFIETIYKDAKLEIEIKK